MKKYYTKPQLVFEKFSLSTNIAASCAIKNDGPSKDQCGYHGDFDFPIFISIEMGCTTTEPDGDYNGICYHNPSSISNVFGS